MVEGRRGGGGAERDARGRSKKQRETPAAFAPKSRRLRRKHKEGGGDTRGHPPRVGGQGGLRPDYFIYKMGEKIFRSGITHVLNTSLTPHAHGKVLARAKGPKGLFFSRVIRYKTSPRGVKCGADFSIAFAMTLGGKRAASFRHDAFSTFLKK